MNNVVLCVMGYVVRGLENSKIYEHVEQLIPEPGSPERSRTVKVNYIKTDTFKHKVHEENTQRKREK